MYITLIFELNHMVTLKYGRFDDKPVDRQTFRRRILGRFANKYV